MPLPRVRGGVGGSSSVWSPCLFLLTSFTPFLGLASFLFMWRLNCVSESRCLTDGFLLTSLLRVGLVTVQRSPIFSNSKHRFTTSFLWRKVPESGARSLRSSMCYWHSFSSSLCVHQRFVQGRPCRLMKLMKHSVQAFAQFILCKDIQGDRVRGLFLLKLIE